MALESQTFEGGALGSAQQTAANPPASQPELRRKWLRERWVARHTAEAKPNRQVLARWYGAERAEKIEFAETFENCEYGRQPEPEEIRKLFPFLPAE